MSDLRHDPINDQWIAVANGRSARPMEYELFERSVNDIVCPFCKGNEAETPKSLVAFRHDGTQLTETDDPSEWTVRVIKNKFPSFAIEDPGQESSSTEAVGNGRYCHGKQFVSEVCLGAQELIIPSPRHVPSLSELNEEELLLSFRVIQDRIQHFEKLPLVKHAMLFLNCGFEAGASLSHLHFQLLGSPVLSRHLQERASRNQQFKGENGCSLIDSLASQEIDEQVRVIEETEDFCVVCPFASRFAYQVWIIPKKRTSDFCRCSPAMRDELAALCLRVTRRLEIVLDYPSYNLLLHLEPCLRPDETGKENKTWYVEIFPRLGRAAGFELGTDTWVNSVSPELAAEKLRPI